MTAQAEQATTERMGVGVLVGLDRIVRYAAAAGNDCMADDVREARAAVAELVAAIPRAIEMLRVAGLHCDLYGSDATSVYDEAVCDGTCIQMDCTDAADSLAAALAPFSEAGR